MKKHSIKSGGIAFYWNVKKKERKLSIDKKVEFNNRKDKIISEMLQSQHKWKNEVLDDDEQRIHEFGRLGLNSSVCKLEVPNQTTVLKKKKILLILLYAKMDMACWQLKHFSSTTLP